MLDIKKSYKWLQRAILFTAIIISIASCSVDRQLAHQYIESPKPNIVIQQPDFIYMLAYNPIKEDTSGLKRYQKDSISFYHSTFLANLEEKKVKESFFSSFEKQFKEYGFNVIPKSSINDTVQTLIISVPQMEMNEYKKTHVDKENLGNKEYYKSFDLNAIQLNTWISLYTSKSDNKRTYFLNDSITDIVDGYFYYDFRSKKVKYRYSSYDIKTKDIYHFMSDMGTLYAQYVYNYYLNRFVDLHRTSSNKRLYIFHYDVNRDKLDEIIGIPWERIKR